MEFLALTLGTTEEFVQGLPSVAHLMAHFGLEAGIAFDIARPKLRLAMRVRSTDFALLPR